MAAQQVILRSIFWADAKQRGYTLDSNGDGQISLSEFTDNMPMTLKASVDEAITLTNGIQEYQGMGHSCGIHSMSDDNVMKLAVATKTSRLLVNQPQAASNSGNLWNGLRQTFSLGCGSWGKTSICDNINWRHLINETWVSRNLATPKELLPDNILFKRIQGKM